MATAQPASAGQQQPLEIYATLAGGIDGEMAKRIIAKASLVIHAKATAVHLLIHSTGGFIGDAVGIYNFLKNMPFKLITYNSGQVSSAAVVVYLAGQERKVSKTAAFLLHKSHASPQAATAERMQMGAESLIIDDARLDVIYQERMKLPPEKRQAMERGDIMLSAEESIKFALATGLGDFVLPPNTPLINLMAD